MNVFTVKAFFEGVRRGKTLGGCPDGGKDTGKVVLRGLWNGYAVGRHKGRGFMGWVNEDGHNPEQTSGLVDVFPVGHTLGANLKSALEAAKR